MTYILDDPDAWETVACNLCGTPHEQLAPISFKGSEEATHLYQAGKWNFVECPKCRLRFYSPRLKQNARCIAETLTNEASKKQADLLFHHGSFWEVADKSAQINHVKKFYGDFIKKCVGHLSYDPLAVYEIGSSIGRLMSVVKELHPSAYVAGCEPNIHAAKFCKEEFGFTDIEETLFQSANAAENFFDLVIGWNLIEHSYTPKEDIRKAFSILKSGGILMLRTFHEEGNGDGFQASPLAHQYHFFQDVLSAMFAECGFTSIKEITGRDFFVYGKKP